MLCKLCLDPSESLRYGSRPIEHWDEERASHFCFVCRLFVWYITHSHCPIPAVEASISQTSWIESNTPIDGNVFYVQCFLSQKDKILFFFLCKLRVRTTTPNSCFVEHRHQRSKAHLHWSFLSHFGVVLSHLRPENKSSPPSCSNIKFY